MTSPNSALHEKFRAIVGAHHVLTDEKQTRRYSKGYRYGGGDVLAVVRPATLLEQWRVLNACVAADVIVIFQAANTGLTGGSTPFGNGYDRPIVLINTMRIKRVDIINEGKQVVCLPGATLDELEKRLKPLGREPHSNIGSSCIGASVIGGVCNNSGGSLIKRGPAYTQFALFARINEQGALELVNHLGIGLGDDTETILNRLDKGEYTPDDIVNDASGWASDPEYIHHIRDIQSPVPARFNSDARRLYEASGSAGKMAIFAVRLDTFEAEKNTKVFYIGTNSGAELTTIRRDILSRFENLPIAAEYMHRDAYDIAKVYGKDTYLTIKHMGTDKMPLAFSMKSRFDALTGQIGLGETVSDKVLQVATKILPDHLPKRLNQYRDKFEHYLMIRMGETGVPELQRYLSEFFPTQNGDFFECTAEEGTAAFLHRFATAGAAVRYRAAHDDVVEDIVALDLALRRNDEDWMETLNPELEEKIIHKLYYGHFFCYVFHQDYVIRKGEDCMAIEHDMLELLDKRGAQYPAEHNVGHLYPAKPEQAEFYKTLDPSNSFNPGIGHTSKCKHWH